jgi:hypothetical protein
MEWLMRWISGLYPWLSRIESNDEAILDEVNRIWQWCQSNTPAQISKATRIALALPTIYRKGKLVANLQLMNDAVDTITILVLDDAGTVEKADPADTFSVVSNNPASLNAVMGTDAGGNPAVVLNALVQVSPGLSFTVSDSAGLKAFTEMVDIVSDTKATAIGLDLANVTSATQPVPTNPGP